MGLSPFLFIYFRLFYKQFTVNNCSIKVANAWIRTRVLWYWKQSRCQLSTTTALFYIILLEKIFEIKFEGLGCEDDVDDYDEMNFDAIENMET